MLTVSGLILISDLMKSINCYSITTPGHYHVTLSLEYSGLRSVSFHWSIVVTGQYHGLTDLSSLCLYSVSEGNCQVSSSLNQLIINERKLISFVHFVFTLKNISVS